MIRMFAILRSATPARKGSQRRNRHETAHSLIMNLMLNSDRRVRLHRSFLGSLGLTGEQAIHKVGCVNSLGTHR